MDIDAFIQMATMAKIYKEMVCLELCGLYGTKSCNYDPRVISNDGDIMCFSLISKRSLQNEKDRFDSEDLAGDIY